jgi:hypothetical protein
VKEDEVDNGCSALGRGGECVHNLVEKSEGKRLLGRFMHRYEDNI